MARVLLNTLFITTEGAFARLDGESVRVDANNQRLLQVPLHHLGSIVLFGGASMSSHLMMRCADDGREVTLLDYSGRYRARLVGRETGNILLRRAQYEAMMDESKTIAIARPIVAGKIKNSRQNLLRAARDANAKATKERLSVAAQGLVAQMECLRAETTLDGIRGVEGMAASIYFGAFGAMIARPPSEFAFVTRTRRPPRDRVNALISFLYSILATDCTGALEGVGLDPQAGFLHALRPGRPALALDLMEEFRPILADRLALTLINRKQIRPEHFVERTGGSVLLDDEGRRIVLAAYQKRRQEEVEHPLLRERTPIGLLPHLQARLLARYLRGDLKQYVPYVPS